MPIYFRPPLPGDPVRVSGVKDRYHFLALTTDQKRAYLQVVQMRQSGDEHTRNATSREPRDAIIRDTVVLAKLTDTNLPPLPWFPRLTVVS